MYHFIINPKSCSGKGIRVWWVVKSELDKRKVSYTANFTRHEGHASDISYDLCKNNSGIKNIIVLGGDGTVNEVINGLHNYKEVLLGYIPSGSSNDLARSLNIPKDPIKALDHILNPSKFKYLDHGIITFLDKDINTRKFSCSSGIGFDASVCLEAQATSLKNILNRFGLGKLTYLIISIKQIITHKPVDGTIVVDGIKKGTYKDILMMSNMIHRYEGGGLLIAPDANPSDRKLSICLVHGLSRLKLMMLLPTLLLGKHIYFKGVEAFNCSNIEIITTREMVVHTDGEHAATCSHISITCIPEQVRMIL